MSKIRLTPNASGTGTVTQTVPSTNTDRTISLPDTAGNVVTTGDTGTITAGMLDGGQSGSTPAFAVRAWANFSGSTLYGGGNVSSITNHQTGDYSINFTTAMPNTNFAVAGLARYDGNTNFPYDKNEETVAIAKGRPDSNSSVRIVTVKLITNPPEYHNASSVRVIVIG